MKQISLTGNVRYAVLLFILIAISSSACVTRPVHLSANRTRSVATKEENHPCINLNTASIDELETLPGIGRVIAERIVAYRTQFGPFRRPEHLMMVRGISDRKFREIQMLVSVE
jgi:competence protein ComEA